MMELLATVLGVGFVALVMLSLCRAAARADAMAQHDWRVFCDEKARKDVYKRQQIPLSISLNARSIWGIR